MFIVFNWFQTALAWGLRMVAPNPRCSKSLLILGSLMRNARGCTWKSWPRTSHRQTSPRAACVTWCQWLCGKKRALSFCCVYFPRRYFGCPYPYWFWFVKMIECVCFKYIYLSTCFCRFLFCVRQPFFLSSYTVMAIVLAIYAILAVIPVDFQSMSVMRSGWTDLVWNGYLFTKYESTRIFSSDVTTCVVYNCLYLY